jgi:hypothetical protein
MCVCVGGVYACIMKGNYLSMCNPNFLLLPSIASLCPYLVLPPSLKIPPYWMSNSIISRMILPSYCPSFIYSLLPWHSPSFLFLVIPSFVYCLLPSYMVAPNSWSSFTLVPPLSLCSYLFTHACMYLPTLLIAGTHNISQGFGRISSVEFGRLFQSRWVEIFRRGKK